MIKSRASIQGTAVICVAVTLNVVFIYNFDSVIKCYKPELGRAYTTLGKTNPRGESRLFAMHIDLNVAVGYVVEIPLYHFRVTSVIKEGPSNMVRLN